MNVNPKLFLAVAKKLIKRRYILFFTNGFLAASLCYFYIENRYEKKIFEALANHVTASTATVQPDSLVLRSLHLTNDLGARRSLIFGNEEINTLKSVVIRPVTFDLMTARGVCGSYSVIMSRILSELNINNRIVQMKVNGKYGGHIIVEAEIANDQWVVMDPLYNIAFRKPDGQLASFSDVKDNWNFYSGQVPEQYDMSYRYEGARYTNWNKIPVLMPALKWILSTIYTKEKVEKLSIRTFFLRKFKILFNATLATQLLIIILSITKYLRRKRLNDMITNP